MVGDCQKLLLVTVGLVLLGTATCQTNITAAADISIQADVTNTVLALLNETGFTANATDPKVQSVVQMLMNGITPTDQHLIDLGIIPAPAAGTTPPTYVVPGGAGPTDTLVNIPGTGGSQLPIQPPQPLQPTPAPVPTNPGGGLTFPQFPSGSGFPSLPGSFPSFNASSLFPSLPGGMGSLPNLNGLFPNMFAPATTTAKPTAVDPFGSLVGPTNNNAVGPKPSDLLPGFPNLGTPGGLSPPPASGILESQTQHQRQQQQNSMNSMLPMLMMMNPELMEMGAESPLMMMMLMQSMQSNQKPAQRQPTPGAGMDMSGLGGMGGMGGMGGLGGGLGGGAMDMMGAGAMPSPLSSSPLGGLSGLPLGGLGSPAGASSTGMTDMMNLINSAPKTGAGAGLTAPGALPPMDFTSMLNGGLLPSPTGATGVAPAGAPAGDMMANLMNMINSPPPTATGGAGPTPLDPFLSGGAPLG